MEVPLLPLALALVRDLAAPGVRLNLDVPEGAVVLCKPDHVQSILENIARNACEAIEET